MNEIASYYQIVERAFERLAPYYDLITLPISRVREQAAALLALDNRADILDVATGTGAQAFAYARYGHNVVSVDLSDAMIAIARKKNSYGNLRFEVADAVNLPFRGNYFDVACISFGLHDMPQAIRESVLKEMARVIKPGGMLVIVDYDLPENRLGRWLIYRLTQLYEGPYYSEFIRSDLHNLLRKFGVELDQQLKVMLGAGRIWTGKKVENGVAGT